MKDKKSYNPDIVSIPYDVYLTLSLLDEKNKQRILFKLLEYSFGDIELFENKENIIEDVLILSLYDQIVLQ